jgi:hypothetical protein
LVGGQWTKAGAGYDLVITNNPQQPNIPIGGKLRTLS